MVETLSKLRINDGNREGCKLREGWMEEMRVRVGDCRVNGE